jgi:hypothetical protein
MPVVRTPLQAREANAIAVRFVQTVRSEGLDSLLILNARNLEQWSADSQGQKLSQTIRVRRRDRLGRLLHGYGYW